jgi:hypothetical protein
VGCEAFDGVAARFARRGTQTAVASGNRRTDRAALSSAIWNCAGGSGGDAGTRDVYNAIPRCGLPRRSRTRTVQRSSSTRR